MVSHNERRICVFNVLDLEFKFLFNLKILNVLMVGTRYVTAWSVINCDHLAKSQKRSVRANTSAVAWVSDGFLKLVV